MQKREHLNYGEIQHKTKKYLAGEQRRHEEPA